MKILVITCGLKEGMTSFQVREEMKKRALCNNIEMGSLNIVTSEKEIDLYIEDLRIRTGIWVDCFSVLKFNDLSKPEIEGIKLYGVSVGKPITQTINKKKSISWKTILTILVLFFSATYYLLEILAGVIP